VVAQHGTTSDPYYWLRDDSREDPAVLAHLRAENAYCAAALADTEALQAALFAEMKGRIQEADRSVPIPRGPYFYYSDTLEGAQYAVHKRRRVPPGSGPVTETTAMDERCDLRARSEATLSEAMRSCSGQQLTRAWAQRA